LRAPGKSKRRRTAPPIISARLSAHITLETQADGNIAACFDGYSVGLGTFSAAAWQRAQALRTGLPLGSFSDPTATRSTRKSIAGPAIWPAAAFWNTASGSRGDKDQVVIEPQVADYWPQTPNSAMPTHRAVAVRLFATARQ
jgi:hypothetical protein